MQKKTKMGHMEVLQTDATNIDLYQCIGKSKVNRTKGSANDRNHTTNPSPSVKHGEGSTCVLTRSSMAVSETGSCIKTN